MASGLAIHIVAGLDKHTEVLMQERIRVGAGADCDRAFAAFDATARDRRYPRRDNRIDAH